MDGLTCTLIGRCLQTDGNESHGMGKAIQKRCIWQRCWALGLPVVEDGKYSMSDLTYRANNAFAEKALILIKFHKHSEAVHSRKGPDISGSRNALQNALR